MGEGCDVLVKCTHYYAGGTIWREGFRSSNSSVGGLSAFLFSPSLSNSVLSNRKKEEMRRRGREGEKKGTWKSEFHHTVTQAPKNRKGGEGRG